MKANQLPDVQYLRDNFKYNELTGKLYRKQKDGYKEIDNEPSSSTGYISIYIQGKLYLIHRIIFKMVHGYDPNIVDHDDKNTINNRIENLIDKNQSGNSKNRKLPSNNTSGTIGVTWDKQTEKWKVSIKVNGVKKLILRTKSLDKAIKARKDAEIAHNFHPNHGGTL